jgi:hypothetical protein
MGIEMLPKTQMLSEDRTNPTMKKMDTYIETPVVPTETEVPSSRGHQAFVWVSVVFLRFPPVVPTKG